MRSCFFISCSVCWLSWPPLHLQAPAVEEKSRLFPAQTRSFPTNASTISRPWLPKIASVQTCGSKSILPGPDRFVRVFTCPVVASNHFACCAPPSWWFAHATALRLCHRPSWHAQTPLMKEYWGQDTINVVSCFKKIDSKSWGQAECNQIANNSDFAANEIRATKSHWFASVTASMGVNEKNCLMVCLRLGKPHVIKRHHSNNETCSESSPKTTDRQHAPTRITFIAERNVVRTNISNTPGEIWLLWETLSVGKVSTRLPHKRVPSAGVSCTNFPQRMSHKNEERFPHKSFFQDCSTI